MNERIFGLTQQDRMPLGPEDAQRARERRKALFDIGGDLGFKKTRTRRNIPPALVEERPGQTEIIRRLLATGDDRRMGEFVYGLFSAVAHGTTFGLANSVTLDAEDMPKTPGVTWGAIYTGSGEVVIVLCAVVIGWGQASTGGTSTSAGSLPPGCRRGGKPWTSPRDRSSLPSSQRARQLGGRAMLRLW